MKSYRNYLLFVVMVMLTLSGCQKEWEKLPDVNPKEVSEENTNPEDGSEENTNPENGPEENTNPEDDSSDQWVDLELPNGLLWATRNVGASSPADLGDYFAWGETSPKSDYNWGTYLYYDYDNSKYTKYNDRDGLKILQPSDDAATANYGGRMPTEEEWRELYENTTSEWVCIDGVYGMCFTGRNGHSLFLPDAGYRIGSELYYRGDVGNYWSSTLYDIGMHYAWNFYFNYLGAHWYNNDDRSVGLSVRAVRPAR